MPGREPSQYVNLVLATVELVAAQLAEVDLEAAVREIEGASGIPTDVRALLEAALPLAKLARRRAESRRT